MGLAPRDYIGLSISFANLTTPIKPDHPLLTEILGREGGGALASKPCGFRRLC